MENKVWLILKIWYYLLFPGPVFSSGNCVMEHKPYKNYVVDQAQPHDILDANVRVIDIVTALMSFNGWTVRIGDKLFRKAKSMTRRSFAATFGRYANYVCVDNPFTLFALPDMIGSSLIYGIDAVRSEYHKCQRVIKKSFKFNDMAMTILINIQYKYFELKLI